MGVRWDHENGGGGQRPLLVCDACGEPLQGAGIAAFDTDASGVRVGRFRLLHPAGCELSEPDTRALPRMDLADFLSALWRNAGLPGDTPGAPRPD
jgi:hypothetical protein